MSGIVAKTIETGVDWPEQPKPPWVSNVAWATSPWFTALAMVWKHDRKAHQESYDKAPPGGINPVDAHGPVLTDIYKRALAHFKVASLKKVAPDQLADVRRYGKQVRDAYKEKGKQGLLDLTFDFEAKRLKES